MYLFEKVLQKKMKKLSHLPVPDFRKDNYSVGSAIVMVCGICVLYIVVPAVTEIKRALRVKY